MPKKASGTVKVSIIRETKKNGDIYIYERKTIYDPIKKYNKPCGKKLKGKILSGTSEVIETRPKRHTAKMSGELPATPEGASKRHVGMLDIVAHVSDKSGVQKQIQRAAADDIGLAQKMMTLAWYAFSTDGGTWPGIQSWTTRYAGQLPYRDAPVTQDMYHDVFAYLGRHEEMKQAIFAERAQSMGQGELIALDSTTVYTESKLITTGRKGPHKDGQIKNVYKIVEIYSISSRQPLAYAGMPGNIPDGLTVPNALKQLEALNLGDVEIVADNGYCTEDNLLLMVKNGFCFITGIEADTKWISPLIEEYRDELSFCGQIMHCDPKFSGVTVTVQHTFKYVRQRSSEQSGLAKGEMEEIPKRLYVHIYYSSKKKADEDVKFRGQFEAIRSDLMTGALLDKEDQAFADKYMDIHYRGGRIMDIPVDRKAYVKRSRYHGFLVLIARKEKDANHALEKYRAREYVEKDFKNGKYHIGSNHPRVWNDDTLDGQLLVQFLAQSMHESFESMLRVQKDTLAVPNGEADHDDSKNLQAEKSLKNWLRKTSMYGILQWFDAIEATRIGDKHWKAEESKRDRLLMDKLGIKPRG